MKQYIIDEGQKGRHTARVRKTVNNTNVKVNNNNKNHNDDNTTTTTLLLLLPLLLLIIIIIIIYSNNNDNTGIQQRHIYKEALHSMFFRSNFI